MDITDWLPAQLSANSLQVLRKLLVHRHELVNNHKFMSNLHTTEGMRVLIADDDSDMVARLSSLVLEIRGISEVVHAYDGRSALDLFHQQHPDIAILDFSMPYATGLDVLMEIRDSGAKCAVIIFTSSDEPSLREACLAAGANHFLVKESDFQTLEIILQGLL